MYFDAGEALPGQEFSGELSSSRQLADEGQMNTYFVIQHSTIWDDHNQYLNQYILNIYCNRSGCTIRNTVQIAKK